MRSILYITLLLSALGAMSQDAFTVSGRAVDEENGPAAFATVSIPSLNRAMFTDERGGFAFLDVPKGRYVITVSSVGYLQATDTLEVKGDLKGLSFVLRAFSQSLGEVRVSGKSVKDRKESTAEAITVIDTREAKLQSADMGQLIARTQGVGVRRSGGLGSSAQISLNGLTGQQVRFFADGVPLEFNGYAFGLTTVPLSIVDRIEVFKGVVPIQFGADALGGAVNLVSPGQRPGWNGGISYQTGSFGTHRMSGNLAYWDVSKGLYAQVNAFRDNVKNDYKIDVGIADEKGKEKRMTVPRFHDAYRAAGVHVKLGLKDRDWAKELSIDGYCTDYAKEVQHNNLMSGIPYGEVVSLRKSRGLNLRYRKGSAEGVDLNAVLGYNFTEREFVDTSHHVYNWHGDVILDKKSGGEIYGGIGVGVSATWQFTRTHSSFARINPTWRIDAQNEIKLTLSPTFVRRSGDDVLQDDYDPLTSERHLLNWVNGLEYTANTKDEKFQNILFVKQYFQGIRALEATVSGRPFALRRNRNYFGAGNALRYALSALLMGKLSYEYAYRLPQTNELFGDGQFVLNNLELVPEASHNVNLEFILKSANGGGPAWSSGVNAFLRRVENMIIFIPGVDRTSTYENVLKANSMGMEVSGSYASSSRRLQLNLNSTYQDLYNNSRSGIFAPFYGDKLPNRPYFFFNAGASYRMSKVIVKEDVLSFFTGISYVDSFYRSWESAGIREFKIVIPKQYSANVGMGYQIERGGDQYRLTAEFQNLTNQKNYDYYGVQKPGRAFYLKISTQF
ncbi:TonB-dependent receptor plug domain-containing protein [Marinilongibacter aquaticus]|uniref:TonB-dependent receptor n=1 Tax=Marinilongibacter aquaticus TaxID=2975157 RepID=UPI0021BD70B7|nr:TonB-dependent receptor [Marinilongibacter aquaticus]UBM58728.1 TonB-dependent receptor plug domain-containing protein [Marinilongibacter aquaticus]